MVYCPQSQATAGCTISMCCTVYYTEISGVLQRTIRPWDQDRAMWCGSALLSKRWVCQEYTTLYDCGGLELYLKFSSTSKSTQNKVLIICYLCQNGYFNRGNAQHWSSQTVEILYAYASMTNLDAGQNQTSNSESGKKQSQPLVILLSVTLTHICSFQSNTFPVRLCTKD